jgi:hypothetical protein
MPTYKVERIVFSLLLLIAMLTAFQPLVRVHGPNGDQVNNAFDIQSGVAQLQENLNIIGTGSPSPNSGVSGSSVSEAPATSGVLAMPFILRIGWLVPWFVLTAFAFSILALLDLLSFRFGAAALSVSGAFLSALAILQLVLMGSSLQTWAEMLMSSASLGSPDDPGLGARVLMTNSFVISPGFGLYVMTTCMFLVSFLSVTRAVPRVRSVMRHDPRIMVSKPIHVRPINPKYQEETCTSLDISRSGLHVEGPSNHYFVGMEVYITQNGLPGGPDNPEQHGSVVRVQKMEDGKCRIGIRIIFDA